MAVDRVALLANEDDESEREDMEYDEVDKEGHHLKKCCCGKLSRRQCAWLVAGLVALGALCIVLVYYVIVPAMVKKIVKDAKLSFEKLVLVEPNSVAPYSVGMNSTISLGHLKTLGFAATLYPSPMHVSIEGEPIGHLMSTTIHVPGGAERIVFDMDSRLFIDNDAAFDKFAMTLINTAGVAWDLAADVTVKISWKALSMTLSKIPLKQHIFFR